MPRSPVCDQIGPATRALPRTDFEVRPTAPWDYALIVDESNASAGVAFTEEPVGAILFSPEGAGVVARPLDFRRIMGPKVSAWLCSWTPDMRVLAGHRVAKGTCHARPARRACLKTSEPRRLAQAAYKFCRASL